MISVGLRRQIRDLPHFDDDGVFRPLDRLAALRPPPTHVVLSVGGNDVRHILGNLSELPRVIETLHENYPAIVKACLKVTRNVILMWQYQPAIHMTNYGVYQAIEKIPGYGDAVHKLGKLLERVYKPLNEMAKDLGLPIADLPRSFDIYNSELYSHQIEPSAFGGEVITSVLSHIVQHDAVDKPSTFYWTFWYCKEEVYEEENDPDIWLVMAFIDPGFDED